MSVVNVKTLNHFAVDINYKLLVTVIPALVDEWRNKISYLSALETLGNFNSLLEPAILLTVSPEIVLAERCPFAFVDFIDC